MDHLPFVIRKAQPLEITRLLRKGRAFPHCAAASRRRRLKVPRKGKVFRELTGFFRSLTNFSIWWPSTPLPIPTSVYSPGESIICKLPHSFPTSSLWAVQYLQRVSPSNKTSNVQVVGQL